MKFKITCAVILALCSSAIVAQRNQFRVAMSEADNFFEIVEKANEYFADKQLTDSTRITDNEYIKFKRWEWHWQTRILPDGSFPDMITQKRIYDDLNASANRDLDNPWTNIS